MLGDSDASAIAKNPEKRLQRGVEWPEPLRREERDALAGRTDPKKPFWLQSSACRLPAREGGNGAWNGAFPLQAFGDSFPMCPPLLHRCVAG